MTVTAARRIGRPPRHAPRKCEVCPTMFRPRGMGAAALPQRFCSRRCWFSWHRGENHQQFAKQTVTCEWCGDDFSRNAFALEGVKHHYCSHACSGRARSASMRADGIPRPARYYSLAYWRGVRERIIERDGGCVRCGLTERKHREHYGCSLHVHHKIRRTKGGTDEDSNLEALCCACHATETSNGR